MIKHTNNTNDNNSPTKLTTDVTTTTTTTTTTIAFFFLLSTTLFALAAFAAFSSPSFTTTHLFSLSTVTTTAPLPPLCQTTLPDPNSTRTQPHHILFSLSGSAATWPDRRRYSELWWSPNHTRGFVYLDRTPDPDPNPGFGPPQRVSGSGGRWAKASDRIAGLVKESFEAAGEREVRWLVMGDDDTVFFTENLATVLSKYDHRGMYYVGGNSESVEQDVMHGYGTAFGGGGFAVSYGLACELVGILDGCIQRYHNYYGSDEKVAACVADLGVSLTKHPGFHQWRRRWRWWWRCSGVRRAVYRRGRGRGHGAGTGGRVIRLGRKGGGAGGCSGVG
ncbi:hypothetical protein KSS87_001078 [Heliosperma pusillum]|nr:hypothetical protein KSS87_001078 [Heliosperma pusillum]